MSSPGVYIGVELLGVMVMREGLVWLRARHTATTLNHMTTQELHSVRSYGVTECAHSGVWRSSDAYNRMITPSTVGLPC